MMRMPRLSQSSFIRPMFDQAKELTIPPMPRGWQVQSREGEARRLSGLNRLAEVDG